jgi:hypothetical protein
VELPTRLQGDASKASEVGEDEGMSRTRLGAAALALVAVLGACSSPGDSSPQSQPPATGAGPTIDPGETGGGHDHGSHGGFGGKKGSGGKGGGNGDGGSGSAETGSDGGGDGGESTGNGRSPGEGSADAGGGEAAQASYPAGGTYVYAQKGTEAFCDPAQSCERYDLPRTQKVATSYGQRTQTEAIVVTEVKSSNGRYVRTTTHFTPGAAFVNEVYYRLVYEGLQLEEQYNPDPPVPQLRFPLKEGRAWKASWKADTSGDYSARVTGMERVDVGSTVVDAFRIETLMSFRGELNGKASVVMWVDPSTRAVVATSGVLDLRASYGSYNTNFETTLRSAPGY